METLSVLLVSIAAILVLASLGMPIAFAIIGVAGVGLYMFGGPVILEVTLQTLPYSAASTYAFVVVPMFVLMGNIAASSGTIRELYDAGYRFTAGARGSLYYATTMGSAGFAAISGSTIVNAAVFTRIALPEMLRRGYDNGLSAGSIAAAGTLAALIPPSLSFVIYGILVQQSIGKLLIAGVVPGLLTAACYMITIFVTLRFRPQLAPTPDQTFSLREKLHSLKGVWAIGLLAFIVIGGIYSGIMTPSAAGAVGAIGALLIAVFRRRMTVRGLKGDLEEAAITTASLFLVIIAGLIFGRFLTLSGFPSDIENLLEAYEVSKLTFMLGVIALFIILGMFIDPISMLVLTIPILMPIMSELDLDPIWFGVVVIKLVEIAVITPPVGINLFAVIAASKGEVRATDAYRGIIPFVLAELVALALIVTFPALSTWLPSQMFG